MKDLSIIIVSYNTKETTKNCLDKLIGSLDKNPQVKSEVVVVDNASKDGSSLMLKAYQKKLEAKKKEKKTQVDLKTIFNSKNLGFGAANNRAIKKSEGKYILLLNSDVYVDHVNFEDLIDYMEKNKNVGALTVKVVLPNGKIDLASHRGFPTLWRSLTYFLKLEETLAKIPKLTRIFGGYHLLHLGFDSVHEIDSPTAAFYLTRKSILNKVGGFDSSFFMYGEDIDLSYRIKELGYKIIYYPLYSVLHLKYQSGLKSGVKKTERKTKQYFYDSMKIFYDKHYADKNAKMLNNIAYFLIDLKRKLSK